MMVLVEKNGEARVVHGIDQGDDPVEAAVIRALLITGASERRIRFQLKKSGSFAVGGYTLSVERVRKLKGKRA